MEIITASRLTGNSGFQPKAVLLSILGTESDIADKYYTHVDDASQLQAIAAISDTMRKVSPQEKIDKCLFTSGSDDCQVANGIKATNGNGYAGLQLDRRRVLMCRRT